jgi:hypothetical protein
VKRSRLLVDPLFKTKFPINCSKTGVSKERYAEREGECKKEQEEEKEKREGREKEKPRHENIVDQTLEPPLSLCAPPAEAVRKDSSCCTSLPPGGPWRILLRVPG